MAGQNNDIRLDAIDSEDNQATKPSFLKRVWSRVSNAIQADTFLGNFLRANIITVLLSLVLLVLFFAFPPFSTQIMLQLGTALGGFAFWTYASSFAGAVSIVVFETYLAVLAIAMTLLGIADGVKKLVDFCKKVPDDLLSKAPEMTDANLTKPASNIPPKHIKLFPKEPIVPELPINAETGLRTENGV